MEHRWTIRGGPMFWLHWLSVHVTLSGAAIVATAGAVGALAVGAVLALSWTLVAIVVGARVALVVDSSGLTIRNGWYERRLEAIEITRLTHQNLPLGGGGRGFGNCLAVWVNDTEGWPVFATVRYSDDGPASLAQAVIEQLDPAQGQRIEFWSSVANRGWRPGSFRRRR